MKQIIIFVTIVPFLITAMNHINDTEITQEPFCKRHKEIAKFYGQKAAEKQFAQLITELVNFVHLKKESIFALEKSEQELIGNLLQKSETSFYLKTQADIFYNNGMLNLSPLQQRKISSFDKKQALCNFILATHYYLKAGEISSASVMHVLIDKTNLDLSNTPCSPLIVRSMQILQAL